MIMMALLLVVVVGATHGFSAVTMQARFSAVAGLARPGLAPGHASAFSAAGGQCLSRAQLPTLLATAAPASTRRLSNWPPLWFEYMPDFVPKEKAIRLLEEIRANAEEIRANAEEIRANAA
ncbi:hypothetical protein T492DRAFT_832060 [Pavlovales sp. CCMP2436]|nr:hypothetical protein T492DRAFT_832060 [Pavlovales sp. CCMP2436]